MSIPSCFYCILETRDIYVNSIYSTISVATKKKLHFNPLMATTGSPNLEKKEVGEERRSILTTDDAKSCTFF